MPTSASTLAMISAVFLLAGAVKGIVGLGLPTVSMALLALFMSPAQAAALLIVPSLVTNVWQMRPFATLPALWRRVGVLQVTACVGTLGTARLLGAPAGHGASIALGAVLVVYAGWSLRGAGPRPSASARRVAEPIVGLLTGVVTAATGVFVVPAVPYLQAIGLAKEDLIQAMGLSFTVSTLALAAALAWNGQASAGNASLSVAMLVPALLGMALGQALRQRLSPRVFRTCFLATLIALGLYMIVEALA